MEARWWPVTSHRLYVFSTAFVYLDSIGEKAVYLSLLPGPIPFSEIAFQIGYTSPSPAMLDTCFFQEIIRVFFQDRSLCKTHFSSLIMTCIKKSLVSILGKKKQTVESSKKSSKIFCLDKE